LCLVYYLLSYNLLVPKLFFINPLTVILAFIGIFMHLLGDAMTKTGVPLISKKAWHIPVIGGYALYDNYLLNALPLILAGYLLYQFLGFDAKILNKLGKFHHFDKIFATEKTVEENNSVKGK
ncbi:MAG: hypothetical protein ACRC37_03860, partial [Lentisphaeria bacterium]